MARLSGPRALKKGERTMGPDAMGATYVMKGGKGPENIVDYWTDQVILGRWKKYVRSENIMARRKGKKAKKGPRVSVRGYSVSGYSRRRPRRRKK